MSEPKSFVIVEFVEKKEVEAVPSTWLRNTKGKLKCLWPPSGSISILVNTYTTPAPNWTKFNVRKWKGSFSKKMLHANLNAFTCDYIPPLL